jgi:hypothetical protein
LVPKPEAGIDKDIGIDFCHRLELAAADAGWIDVWFGINTPRLDPVSWSQTAGGAQLLMTATYLPLTCASHLAPRILWLLQTQCDAGPETTWLTY